MFQQARKTVLTVAALGALALGGSALADAAGTDSTKSQGSSQSSRSAPPRGQNPPGPPPPGARGRGFRGGPPGCRGKGEKPLKGETAKKVKAAAEAKVGGATVDRVETNGDHRSAYEAHVRKSDGTHLEVLVNKDFKVTAVNKMPAPPALPPRR